jgi:hypothetical protein
MIDMNEVTNMGVLVDMEYEIVDGEERAIDVSVHNIAGDRVGSKVELYSPYYKLAFAGNFLKMLEQERNK